MNESDEIPHVNGRNLLMRVPSSPSTPYSSSMPILSKLNGLSILQAESAATRRRRGRLQPVFEEVEENRNAKTEVPIRCLECNIHAPCFAMCYCMACLLRIKMCSGCGQSETHTHHMNRMNRGHMASSFIYVCIRCAQSMVFNHNVSSSP